jgi:hypothetical protein
LAGEQDQLDEHSQLTMGCGAWFTTSYSSFEETRELQVRER